MSKRQNQLSRTDTQSRSLENQTGTSRTGKLHENTVKDSAVSIDADGTVIISAEGDVVLSCKAEENSEEVRFRVISACLKKQSKYFAGLLGSTRFVEGINVLENASSLPSTESAVDRLPRIQVIDVGRTSPIKSIRPLLTHLFLLLHYGHIGPSRKIPLANLTNLAIAADRFDAIPALSAYVRSTNAMVGPRGLKYPLQEEIVRQRLLVGLLLGDGDLVRCHSTDLILSGSKLWTEDAPQAPNDALWWDLPRNIEDELMLRRTAILDTIWSLIGAYLETYASKSRKCKLGYDTSPQCDSFQLGEFVKFLARTGHLSFSSNLMGESWSQSCDKTVHDILASLRSSPSYQLDSNHSHCGPRKQILAGLRFIESCLGAPEIGICLECWNDRKNKERSWSQLKQTLSFDISRAYGERKRLQEMPVFHPEHAAHHSGFTAPEFFMSTEKIWNLGNNIADQQEFAQGSLQSVQMIRNNK